MKTQIMQNFNVVLGEFNSNNWRTTLEFNLNSNQVIITKGLNPYATVNMALTPKEFEALFTDDSIQHIKFLIKKELNDDNLL